MEQRRRIASPGAMGALRAHPMIAVTSIIALVATMAFGGNSIYQAQSEGGSPIQVAEQTVNFGSGDNVVVDDAAIASQGGVPGPKTVKEFTSDTEFSMFALTWDDTDSDFASYVRAEGADGSWGPWYAAAPMDEVSENGKRGTDLIYVEPTKRVQVSVAGVDLGLSAEATDADTASLENVPEDAPVAGQGGPAEAVEMPADDAEPVEATDTEDAADAAGEAPAAGTAPAAGLPPVPSNYGDIQPVADTADTADVSDSESATPGDVGDAALNESTGPISADSIETVLIDPNLDAGLGEGIDMMATSDGMPPVISRAGWGANESWNGANSNPPVKAVTVHHTAGSNNYSATQAPGIVRGIHKYHASTLGWGDVGYNALVDKYGKIYEGRAGGLDGAVQGAHVGGFNSNTWGISLLGDYESAAPTEAALEAMGQLAGWKAANSDFDPTGETYLTADFNFGGSRYQSGQGDTFPNINAHRDFHYNTCPGGNLYAQMDTIRQIAKKRYTSIKSGTTDSGTTTPTATDTTTTAAETTTPVTSPDDTTEPTNTTEPTATTEPTTEPEAEEPTSEDRPTQGPAAGTPTALLSSALDGDAAALLTIGGTVAGILVAAAAAQGALPGGVSAVGDVEVINGLSISELTPVIDGLVSMSGNSEIEQTWKTVNTAFGPVLGNSQSGVVSAGQGGPSEPVDFALFDNGIIVSDEEAGTHALWGAMADAWAGQGFDVGPLGLPTSDPTETGNGDELKVEFEGGSITYDPNTDKVNISTQ